MNEENKDGAELGYTLLPKHVGKGFDSNIAKILLERTKVINLKRITAIIAPNNLPSRKILMKMGFEL
ncbi:GNAT family N-acetyltransferase [Peribacillus loiseleuriae]|uniref:GNAT family N-acetyltransferase n=1 Tax=Peribacillus loiseleuriae TaxID=1679170 RepID=UPI00069F4297|nr:GNAT family N-acetyltransferase [Peribacillus loiseleuriae]